MSKFKKNNIVLITICVILYIIGFILLAPRAPAYTWGHEKDSPKVQAWYARQKQPDAPAISCCGDYDAYWADEFERKDGKFFAIITDTREGKDIPEGTRVEIPENKLPKDDRAMSDPNPSGHGIVFLSIERDIDGHAHPGHVYCYYYPVLE